METATTEIADVVLPAQAFTEREGTFTSGERRVQRFYAAVPPTGDSKADFSITAQIASHMGVDLEGVSVSVVFDILANSIKSFEGLNYARLAEVKPQWPIINRGDLYYGGTTYENRHGMGAHLSAVAARGETASAPQVQREAASHPKEKELLAVPITKLYDRGTTVIVSKLLHERIGDTRIVLHPEAAKRLGVEEGRAVNVSFDGVSGAAVVKLDDSISEAVALVPRSMGIAIHEPVAVEGGSMISDWTLWLEWFIKSVILIFALLGGFAYLTWYERRALARIQTRVGPNRAGPFGLLQPIADAVKLIFKEELTPAKAYKFVFFLAPILTVVPSIIIAAVIPWGRSINLFGREITLYLADINVGILYFMSIAAISVYGIVLAGWSSNSKYAMLGGLRATAQMISYELSLGIALVPVILLANSMRMIDIVETQSSAWFVLIQPVGALIFWIATLAEVNRAPFDMPEAEQELTAGFHSEYSGMKFALFFMAEYQKMIIVCAIMAVFFFGGYLGPGVDQFPILGPVYMFIKVVVLLFGMIWVRATWPRIRYDRLMEFGWKILVPLSLVIVFITAAGILLAEQFNNNIFLWTIPVVSVIVALIPVIMIYRSLRRISYERA